MIIKHTLRNASNNRFNSGYIYDEGGNLIKDAEGRTIAFDGDNKQTEVKDAAGSRKIFL